MRKTDWLKLADAYIAEAGYWHDLYELKIKTAKKHGIGTDFVGNDYFDGPLTTATEDLLGDDFCYWCYDCDQSFDAFNKGITLADGTHPNVHSLKELYEFAQEVKNEQV